jgi:hypothetical protein
MNQLLFDSLEIRQFRAFDFLKIEQLGHVNLILGKNNVGKSTLLEALYLFSHMGSPRSMRSILDSRDEPLIQLYAVDAEPAIWRLFHAYPPLEKIKISIQIGRIGAPNSALLLSVVWFYRPESEGIATNYYRLVDDIDDFNMNNTLPALEIKYGTFRRLLRLDQPYNELCRRWDLQNSSDNALATPCVFVVPGGFDDATIRFLWENIALTEAKDTVLEALRIIAPETEDFALLTQKDRLPSFRLRLRGRAEVIPVKAMGDGMNRLVGLSMALAHAKDGILLVDEIENGVHWSVLPYVWKFIVKVAKRLNVQVFATTHSHDCLRAFHFGTKGDPEVQGVAVRLEKREGEFHSEIFDEQRLAVIVKEGIEIR